MKNFLKITLGCAILAMLVALTSYRPASAEAKAIDIFEDTYNVDLDGNGKDEEIYVRIEHTVEEFVYSIDVTINGKKAFSETLQNNEFIDQANIGFVDINSKDKYIELVIEVAGENSCNERVFRYKKKKLKLLFDTGWMDYLEGIVPEQEKGKNVLMYTEVTTPIGNYFYVITNNKIKKKKLKEVTPKDGIYTVIDDSWGGRKYIYYLAKDADIYTKPDGKKVKLTLEEGTGFYITQLKKIKGEFAYALVSLDGGENEIGWLDLTGVTFEDMLVTNPSFAG